MAMTATRDVPYSQGIPTFRNYPLLSSQSGDAGIASGRLASIYVSGANKGKVRDFLTGSTLRFLGVFTSGTEYTVGSGIEVEVIDAGVHLKRISVAGSSAAAIGDFIYASDGDPKSDLTVTPNAGEPVGRLVSQDSASSLVWDIELLPSAFRSPFQPLLSTPTHYTADGAITLPTIDLEAVSLTGASSAAMTLAAPAASFVGKRVTIFRSGGSGTHDVDYADELGAAITFTFSASGDAITLLAVNTTGWRRVG